MLLRAACGRSETGAPAREKCGVGCPTTRAADACTHARQVDYFKRITLRDEIFRPMQVCACSCVRLQLLMRVRECQRGLACEGMVVGRRRLKTRECCRWLAAPWRMMCGLQCKAEGFRRRLEPFGWGCRGRCRPSIRSIEMF